MDSGHLLQCLGMVRYGLCRSVRFYGEPVSMSRAYDYSEAYRAAERLNKRMRRRRRLRRLFSWFGFILFS